MLESKRFTIASAATLAAFLASAGCISTQTATTAQVGEEDERSDVVHHIKLTESVAEVGKPFKGELIYHDNYIQEPEYAVEPIPPGLKFDAENGVLKGVPTKPGFYRITVAVRQRPEKEPHFISPDERWWTDETELAVYHPIEK